MAITDYVFTSKFFYISTALVVCLYVFCMPELLNNPDIKLNDMSYLAFDFDYGDSIRVGTLGLDKAEKVETEESTVAPVIDNETKEESVVTEAEPEKKAEEPVVEESKKEEAAAPVETEKKEEEAVKEEKKEEEKKEEEVAPVVAPTEEKEKKEETEEKKESPIALPRDLSDEEKDGLDELSGSYFGVFILLSIAAVVSILYIVDKHNNKRGDYDYYDLEIMDTNADAYNNVDAHKKYTPSSIHDNSSTDYTLLDQTL
eukprot:CAMPEP_0170515660 /NCGR_PEP_ID=MMETSP0209-20121228/2064_1 /TAXON_ID=665100 ORGANISM="Litonotus pictus, Strain P1" /NCGR_SAMPLE_ID=MMETSP0209 /ASSEMBLY_ACC=CAM_ASM_000301 /LENGTH=257 /DNA_ID=CAMNT_0010800251 /DNA_START=11 /DNA_END=784 /DNA_ORIENTATION=-